MSKFQEHVTSTAFSIALSKKMVGCLMLLNIGGRGRVLCIGTISTLRALEDRGLIYWKKDKNTGELNGCYVTKEGEAMCVLLKMAGYEVPEVEAANEV